jgi:transposase
LRDAPRVHVIVQQKGEMPVRTRKDKIQVNPDLLKRLYLECDGYTQRVHQKLVEDRHIQISYPTLTRLLRELGLRRSREPRCERVPAEPGAEIKRQTTLAMQQAQAHVPKSVVAAREWLAEITYGWRPTKFFQTEPKDRRELATLLDLVRDGILRDRKKAATILARKAGWANQTVAKILHAPRRYTRRYFEVYSQSGLQGLFGPKTPSPLRVARDAEKANRILALLHCRPDSLGFNRMSWTQDDLVRAYKARHSEPISRSAVNRLIKKVGYAWRKARRVLTSPNPNYQEKVELLWKTLQSLRTSELLFYCDEWGPVQVRKRDGRAYRLKDSLPRIPRHQVSKGTVSLAGALSATTNQITWLFVPSKDSQSMIGLLEMLYNQYHDKSKLYVTWDAVSWHNSVVLIEWVDEFNTASSGERGGPTIEFIPLPTSAQFLNAIEGVFSGMTRAAVNNSDYKCSEDMKVAISRHFDQRNRYFTEHPARAGKKIWEPNHPDFNALGPEGNSQ